MTPPLQKRKKVKTIRLGYPARPIRLAPGSVDLGHDPVQFHRIAFRPSFFVLPSLSFFSLSPRHAVSDASERRVLCVVPQLDGSVEEGRETFASDLVASRFLLSLFRC